MRTLPQGGLGEPEHPVKADPIVFGSVPVGPAPGAVPGETATAVLERDGPASAVPHLRGRGTVRFLWQADAQGRFASVSASLADTVGEGSAAIVGRTWSELAGDVVADDAGLSGCFARKETWSGRTVRWRVAGAPVGVAVDLAGMPISGPDGTCAGFRGFGLIRTAALTWWISPEASPAGAHEPRAADLNRQAPSTLPERQDKADTDEPETVAGGDPPGPRKFDGIAEPISPERRAEMGASPIPSMPEPTLSPGDTLKGRVEEPDDGDGDAGLDEVVPVSPHAAVEPEAWPRPTLLDQPDPGASPPSREEAPRAAPPAPHLSEAERSAFREIARSLGARLADAVPVSGAEPLGPGEAAKAVPPVPAKAPARSRPPPPTVPDARAVLDRLPLGALVHRGEEPLFANRLLLDLVGYESVEAVRAAGGVARLFGDLAGPEARSAPVALITREGRSVRAEVRLTSVDWGGKPASLLLVRTAPEDDPGRRLQVLERDLRVQEARARELVSILDTATDGVIVLDDAGRILSLNRSAEALFGYEEDEVAGDPLAVLLAPESHALATDYLRDLRADGVASLMNDGRNVVGRARQGGSIPLFMTLGRVGDGPEPKFCAVLRDVTALEGARRELAAAKHAAEEANARKSDVLAKVSHETRTPLSAIIGFAEVMLEERFGAVGNERYRDYLRDIHDSGRRVVSLMDDLLDLARIEAGRMELSFASVGLNALVGAAVGLLQPQAARERVVVRTSFAPKLPAVLADERSLRQIVSNLVGNAIKFTEAGGQVIVSTAATDRGEVAIRVRDTGIGMNAEEMEAALEPFRPLAVAPRGGGAGLGLPLTKALVEANRGTLHIASARDEGTLAEVLFPPTRVLAG